MKKYSISPLMLMLMAAFIVIDGSMLALLSVCAALLHELAHIIALKCLGGEVTGVFAGGKGIALRTAMLGYRQEAVTAAAGPIFSLCAAAVSGALFLWLENKNLFFFAFSNSVLFLINALPIYPLDGGRVLLCLLLLKLPQQRVYFIIKLLSFIFLLPLGIISVIIVIRSGFNLSLLIICIYLVILQAGVMNI